SIWSDAPASEILALILRAKYGKDAVVCRQWADHDARYRIFSYREDFAQLWKIEDFLGQAQADVVIVWDGVPKDENSEKTTLPRMADNGPSAINVADRVTVYDWLVALCCAASQQLLAAPRTPLPNLRLFVLDLQPPGRSSAFGVRAFPAFFRSLSWTRVYC